MGYQNQKVTECQNQKDINGNHPNALLRIYHVGGGLSISLGGLYVGALLDQEAETVQLVVSGRVV